jgi:multidrug efflux pump subunit AcrA (membrane-fusion protein)
MTKRLKTIIIICAIAAGALVLGVIGWRVAAKILQGAIPRRQAAVTVAWVPLTKQTLAKTLSFRGIVEGDPQVRVFSNVAGKFSGNAVAEGDMVAADQVIAYVGRDVVGQTFQPAPVRSPVAGMVKKLYFTDRGALVNVDKPVAEIAFPGRVKIVLTVGESDLSRVKTGQDAVIRSPFDATLALPARVFSVTPFVDSDTFSGGIIIKADNRDGRVKIGMSALADIVYETSEAFAVPVQAVQQDMESAFVFLNIEGKARRTAVKTGYMKGDLMEISGDLKAGDLVVTDGSFKLSDGATITQAEESTRGRPPQGDASVAPRGGRNTGREGGGQRPSPSGR